MKFKRIQHFKNLGRHSAFLWGPRQVGKSTLLKQLFPTGAFYNLLDPTLYQEFQREPTALFQRLNALPDPSLPIIIDEVQKIPPLLDTVQLMIDERQFQFILCGSSARKLKRGGGNLLGGRALRYELYPLVYPEIPNFDLLRALNHGLLPQLYLAHQPLEMISAYVGNYLREEIFAEGLTRNQQAFSQFLDVAALSNGEVINYSQIASECGVKSVTIKEYFQILIDTLIGAYLPCYRLRPKRRIIQGPKFYFFDVGLTNFLLKRSEIMAGSENFGRTFEHFLYQELSAHSHYSRLHYPISYWRTTSDIEVDFILGGHEIALEVKATKRLIPRHLKGLKAFGEEYAVKKALLVCLEDAPKVIEGITVLPWRLFLEQLWAGELMEK